MYRVDILVCIVVGKYGRGIGPYLNDLFCIYSLKLVKFLTFMQECRIS